MNSVEVAIEEVVEDVVETVEDLTGITLPTYDVDVTVKPTPPSQTLPPPPAKNSLLPPADQKLELPTFTFPKVEIPEPPKKTTPPPPKKQTPPPQPKKQAPPPQPKVQSPPVELPKISLPKVSIPELPKPSAISSPPPKADVPKPPVKKEMKKEDPYMFTEAALKEFIAKDKPQVTELDKQQEEERKKKEARDAEIRRAAEAATNAFKSAAPSAPVVKKEPAKKKQPPKGAATPQLSVQSIAKQSKPKAQPKKKEEPISVPPVKGRPTFSLFGLGGGTKPVITSPATTESSPKTKTPPVEKVAKTVSAPRGVPIISKWKLDASDNTISGFISGSGSFKDGEPVTTSAIVGGAESNTVVRTKSGSR